MTDPGEQRELDQLEGVPPPEASERLIGHAEVEAQLAAQITAGRLGTGILLHGPRGIGKATLAFHVIANLIAATGDEPIDRVRAQIAAGAHPNVFVLRIPFEDGRFRTEIRVGNVRQLIEKLHLTRGRAGHIAVVIDAAEDCNQSAANALLKSLEEPPANTHFFLISHQPGRLLPTVRSRCQSYAMRALGPDEMASFAASHGGEGETAEFELAAGNPRRLCELQALGDTALIEEVRAWLAHPLNAADARTLSIARSLADRQNAASEAFVRRLILDWIASEARNAASSGAETNRLASADALWEKATRSFTETDIFNLDLAATYLTLLDAISAHERRGTGQLIAQ
ncbi:MAG: AAA family ATPase [Hyphomicrobiaceae bacterium]|nr:AAA family ATPase [Hyphomicrobiaceae bacterium]